MKEEEGEEKGEEKEEEGTDGEPTASEVRPQNSDGRPRSPPGQDADPFQLPAAAAHHDGLGPTRRGAHLLCQSIRSGSI